MGQIKYTVRRPFKYGKRRLKQGDEWIPAGSKFDADIATSPLVYQETVEPKAAPKGAKANDPEG